MKKSLIISALMLMPFISNAQTQVTPALEAYFSAIIVTDFNASIDWYTKALGFKVINKVESEERGFKQSNLKREQLLIELIELDRAVLAEDVVPNYNARTRITGFFKLGFLVADFDAWMNHLTNEEVTFYGDVVADENTGKRMAIITDPDGNRIQIFEK